MLVLARHSLAARAAANIPGADAASAERLLLEGTWPASAANDHSLDASIHARHDWIDEQATALAERAGPAIDVNSAGEPIDPCQAIAYLRALSLRYRAVKYLRPLAFFSEERTLHRGEPLHLCMERDRDEDYVALFGELSRTTGACLQTHWIENRPNRPAVQSSFAPAAWRRWLGRVAGNVALRARGAAPRVCLAGNPRILDPVCRALLEASADPVWLTERFAVGLWRRWRRRGVHQIVSGSLPRVQPLAAVELSRLTRLECRGVSLGPAFAQHLSTDDRGLAAWQLGWLPALHRSLEKCRPDCVLLDEDATPWKRAVVATARALGIRTLVVQHGAACVSFGFAPLAADAIAVWDEGSRRQLVAWGVPADRIFVCGAPQISDGIHANEPPAPARRNGRSRILLLATTTPRDERPDSVAFHLTTETHRQMFEVVFEVARRLGIEMIVKPHPRATELRAINAAADRHPGLHWSYARPAPLSQLLRDVDCVVSFASTAGVEAALSGWPVVQVLPAGSGDVMSAADWGGVGSARTTEEFSQLLKIALARCTDRARNDSPRPKFDVSRSAGRSVASLAIYGERSFHELSHAPVRAGADA